MEQRLCTFFDRLEIFDPELRKRLRELLQVIYLQRGECLYRQGDTLSDYFLKLEGGLARSYFIMEDGKETTVCFDNSRNGCLTCDIPQQGAAWIANTTLEAMTSFYIVAIPVAEVDELGRQYPEVFGATYRLSRESLRFYQESLRMRTNVPARERVIWFNRRFPEFNGLAKEWQIASYLGIHQVTLCNIRAQLRNESEPQAAAQNVPTAQSIG